MDRPIRMVLPQGYTMARQRRNRATAPALYGSMGIAGMTDDEVSRVFGTHAQARQAAAELVEAGLDHGGISLIDGHRDGGGTTMTVRATAEQRPLVAAVLSRHATLPGSSPTPADTAPLRDGAPAYVAGGTANLGTPGPD